MRKGEAGLRVGKAYGCDLFFHGALAPADDDSQWPAPLAFDFLFSFLLSKSQKQLNADCLALYPIEATY